MSARILPSILCIAAAARLLAQAPVPVQVDLTGSVVAPPNFTASNVDAGMVFGQEYLSRFHRQIMAGVRPRVIFSGDSTTQGGGAIEDLTRSGLSQAFKAICLDSLGSIECLNAGHPGAELHAWLTSYLAQDLAQAPDLYILRWGLNPNVSATESFETDLRAGLQTLRSAFPIDRMSLVLMTPNAANDSPNGRDRAYLDRLNPVLRRAARDFKCVFIDLARLFPDATSDPTMMDDAYGDGRRVHPRDVFNQAIASLIADVVLPKGVASFGTSHFQNPGGAEPRHDAGAPPGSFHAGITMEPAAQVLGWPFDGAVITERQATGTSRQVNYAASLPGIRTRTGSATAWNPWGDAIVVNPAPEEATLAATNTPKSLPTGVSVWAAPAERGWPASGQVTSIRQFGGTCLQVLSDDAGGVAVRTRANDEQWNRWSPLGTAGAGLGVPIAHPAPGAGGGATLEVMGTDSNGRIQLTTGDAPLAAADVLTVLFGNAWPADPHPVLSPANGAAAALGGAQQVFVSSATRTQFVLGAGTASLAPRTTYTWHWMVGLGAAVPETFRAAALRLTAQVGRDGGFDLVVAGIAGRSCVIEASSDVVRWEVVEEIQLPSLPLVVRAAANALDGNMFFRARIR